MEATLTQNLVRLLALRPHQMSAKLLLSKTKLGGVLSQRIHSRPVSKSFELRTLYSHPTSLTTVRNSHVLSQRDLKSMHCYTRFGNHEKIRVENGVYLHRRHLVSDSKDGDREAGDSVSDRTEVKDQSAKVRAAQRFQSMHQLLEEAQVQDPSKDFDFSDVPHQKEDTRQPKSKDRPRIDPREMTVFLFPGQGTQFIGMGRRLLDYPNVREMYSVASDILGYDLLDLCLNGTQEELNRTIHCQPAVLVCSLAAVEKLKEEQPKAVENCVSASGFSVGEFSALVFSGALTFEDAIQLIKIRAEAMQRASELVPSGMLSVVGRPGVRFKMMCREAMDTCILNGMEDPVCTIASHLFPEAKVIAGHIKALDFIQEMVRHYSLRVAKRVPVSGAFHSQLMAPAASAFSSAVDKVPFEAPAIAVYSNVDGKRYRYAKHIQRLLKRQLLEPILWEQTMHEMYQRTKGDSFPKTYEVGPGKQLGGFLQRNNLKAYHSYLKVDV